MSGVGVRLGAGSGRWRAGDHEGGSLPPLVFQRGFGDGWFVKVVVAEVVFSVVSFVVFCRFVGVDCVEFGSEVGEEVARVNHHLALTPVKVLHRVLSPPTEEAGVNVTPLAPLVVASRRFVRRASGGGSRLRSLGRGHLSLLRGHRRRLGKGLRGGAVIARGWVQPVVCEVVSVML